MSVFDEERLIDSQIKDRWRARFRIGRNDLNMYNDDILFVFANFMYSWGN